MSYDFGITGGTTSAGKARVLYYLVPWWETKCKRAPANITSVLCEPSLPIRMETLWGPHHSGTVLLMSGNSERLSWPLVTFLVPALSQAGKLESRRCGGASDDQKHFIFLKVSLGTQDNFKINVLGTSGTLPPCLK